MYAWRERGLRRGTNPERHGWERTLTGRSVSGGIKAGITGAGWRMPRVMGQPYALAPMDAARRHGFSLALWLPTPCGWLGHARPAVCIWESGGSSCAATPRKMLKPADSRGNRRFGKLHILRDTHEGARLHHFAKIPEHQNPAATCRMFPPQTFPPTILLAGGENLKR